MADDSYVRTPGSMREIDARLFVSVNYRPLTAQCKLISVERRHVFNLWGIVRPARGSHASDSAQSTHTEVST